MKNKVGRPEVKIDWEKINGYLKAQCDGVGIAGILGIAPITLYRACKKKHKVNFDVYSAQKKSEGVELLKAAQYSQAMGGNIVMQIWLGKQYAGQKDKNDITTNNEKITGINVTYIDKINGDTNAGKPGS